MKYIVYNNAGEILRSGVCPESLFSMQAGPGEFVMEGEANDAIHKIENGVVVEKEAPPPPPPPSEAEVLEASIKAFSQEIQKILDEKAVERGYDNILSACSYASTPNYFQQEGIAFVQWRSAVWAYCYSELEKVKNGQRVIPDIALFKQELPEFSYVA